MTQAELARVFGVTLEEQFSLKGWEPVRTDRDDGQADDSYSR